MIADGLLLKRAHQISAFLARHNSQSICTPSTSPFPTWDNCFDSLKCWQTPRQSLHGLIPQRCSTIFTIGLISEDVDKPLNNLYMVWFLNMLTNLSTIFTNGLIPQYVDKPLDNHYCGCGCCNHHHSLAMLISEGEVWCRVWGLTSWYCFKGTVHWSSLTPLMFVMQILQCQDIKTTWVIKMGDCELKNLKICTWPFVVPCSPIW